ncbi:hypothetical protein GPECTOR_19g195 [Gonium pectorale]|uniref:Uncharacterized protein n=1 Tax=Gonium pectorale TaxID=33097 RepID=A0A150GIZ1_GONPE|nr:hypothetical protein GPECTOR_19g195 [Gonium pectorale]|eukprot:KXZ49744.1 hypothetical protein GPECTOR_19g195 [Gonium pectorale]
MVTSSPGMEQLDAPAVEAPSEEQPESAAPEVELLPPAVPTFKLPVPDAVPLLVPLVGGAAINLDLDGSDQEAQMALIERYLQLMGVGWQPPGAPAPSAAVAAAPAPAAGAAALPPAVEGGALSALGGEQRLESRFSEMHGLPAPTVTDDGGPRPPSPRFDVRKRQAAQPAATAAGARGGGGGGPVTALAALGLDRSSLARRAIPDALINAIHRGLAANATAFFRTWVAERRRLAVLTHASGPAVPLADRLLAFITGVEGELTDGSSLPYMDEIRNAKDVQAVLDSFRPASPPPHQPFHHELIYMRRRQQQEGAEGDGAAATAEGPRPTTAEEEAELAVLMDLDKITDMASAGNVAGLRALLRGLVGALDYSRTSLKQRLAVEGERAQREWARATEARRAADKLREQLVARNKLLAERGAELEAACRRATAAEEALVTERAVVAGLRGQLRQLTADYEAQNRGLRAGLEARVELPEGLKLSSIADSDHQLGSQLAALRSDLALSELSRQQERAVAAQLRVMLDSVRGTVDMHAARAAAAAAEAERLKQLLAATQDSANANTTGLILLQQQLDHERAAHRRTTEQLQSVSWKVDHARTTAVDIRARAAHGMRRLQVALADMNLRAAKAELQLCDVNGTLQHTQRMLEQATNGWEALKDRNARLDAEIEDMRQSTVAAGQAAKRAEDARHQAEQKLKTAEARIEQLQQKVMQDAQVVVEGKAASSRLEVLEKEHADLSTAHSELRAEHTSLEEAHAALTTEVEAARVRLAELELKREELEQLTVKHEALVGANTVLEAQHAEQIKANYQLVAELNNLKRHADVLETQCAEMREQVERTELDLEAEKDKHRHTKNELDITAAHRDGYINRCEDLQGKIDKMDILLSAAQDDINRCRRAVELAESQRAEAFAMRDAWSRVRLLLSCDVREYLSAIGGQVDSLATHLSDLRVRLTELQSRLLDLTPAVLEGTGVDLPAVRFEESQKVCDSLFKVVSSASQLLETQAAVRKGLMEQLENVEVGLQSRLLSTTEYWRQVLNLARATPKSMVQMVERMTGQMCRELELDPANPLSKMVPIGVLEEAGVMLSSTHEKVGGLRSDADVAKAQQQAAAQLLEHEREVSAARATEFQALVDALSREVNRLKARVGSLEANNAMQQRVTADMQRMLTDAEWKVAKAQEREALTGIRNMVPVGRETKAVQTVHSDLYVLTGGPGTGPSRPQSPVCGPGGERRSQLSLALSASPSMHSHHTHSQSQLLRHRSLPGEGAPEGSRGPSPEGEESEGEAPASLPPLSASSSPAATARGGGGVGGGPLRSSGSGALVATSARGHSNLSRSSTAVQAGVGASGPLVALDPSSVMLDLPAGPSSAPVLPLAAPLDQGPPSGRGPSGGSAPRPALVLPPTTGSPPSSGGPAVAFAVLPPSAAAPSPRQRRSRRGPEHPPGLHASAAESSWLSSAPSLGSVASAGSVGSEAAAHTGGAADGGDVSDHSASGRGGGGGGTVTFASEEEELDAPESPMLALRARSVTAAAAASFAAAGSGSGSHHGMPHRSGSSVLLGGPGAAPVSLPARLDTAGASPFGTSSRPGASSAASSRPGSPAIALAPTSPGALAPPPPLPAPLTPSGIPHGWQHAPWDWLPEVAPLARAAGAAAFSSQAFLELIADIYYTKGLHDQVSAAAAFPATPMQQYIGAYFEARYGPRGSSPPAAEQALAQLLASLEAHSALYEVVLFARVAGLQAWTGKANQSRRNSAMSRPSTSRPLPQSPGGGFSRPGTSRPSHAGLQPLSPYAAPPSPSATSASGAAPGGLPPSCPSPRSSLAGPASRVASAHRPSIRTASARNSAIGAPPSSGLGLALVPAGSPPGLDLPAPGPAPAAGGPARCSRSSSPRAAALSAASSPAPPPVPSPPPAKRPLRVRPEALVSEQLGRALEGLSEVPGMEPLSRFVHSGRLLARLQAADLGAPLLEEQHPELFFVVQRVCTALGLADLPELFVREALPHGHHTMLLQLPSVATSALGLLAEPDVDRPPGAQAGGQGGPASTQAGGWRRRAALVLTPALVAAAPLAASPPPAACPLDFEELQALLGAALTPMAMPGGTGWRYDVQASGAGAPASSGGSLPAASATEGSAAAGGGPSLLSAAEVVTIANLAALKPRAAMAALPSQLQVRWERLLGHLRTAAAAATASADRGALLVAQAAAPAVRAVFRAASCAAVAEGPEGQLGSGEELLLQAQAMPWSEEELLGTAAMPAGEVAEGGPDTRRAHALARVVLVARWAEAAEYRQALRAAVM